MAKDGHGLALATTARAVTMGGNTDSGNGGADPHLTLRGVMDLDAGDDFTVVETEGHHALRFGTLTSRDGYLRCV